MSSPARPSLRFVVLLAFFVLAVSLACKKKSEPSPATVARAAELKPKVTQLLAQVASLSAKSKSAAAAGTLDQKPGPGTVVVIGETFLEKPNRTADPAELDLSDPTLSVCQYIVDATQIKDEDIKSLENCSRFEYAAVIQERSFTPPDADDGTAYTPGRFSGNVLLFHLPKSELRGSYTLDVSQSDQLELTSTSGQKPAAHEWRKQAMTYLRNHVREAASKKLSEG